MSRENLLVREAVEAWNRCNISDDMLRLLINRARSTIEFLEAFGERGLVVSGLRQQLISFENMQQLRKSE